MEAMGRLIREMKSGLCDSPVIAGQMETLAGMLAEVKGKKVYGYLRKPVKMQVDAIVDELAVLPEVAGVLRALEQTTGRGGGVLQRQPKKTPAPLSAEGVQIHQEYGHSGGGAAPAGRVHLRGRIHEGQG